MGPDKGAILKMNNKKRNLLFLLILSVFFSGCNFPTLKEENADEQKDIAVATIVAQTLTALENQIQPTPPLIEEVPTQTTMPTLEIPVQTQLTVTPMSLYSQEGCLIASSISETIPDDTIFDPGDSFNKTWTVINSGTCDWTTNFQLVYLNGDQMEGISPTFLSSNVPAGNIIDLTLPLTAPAKAGTYRGDWALQAEDGTMVTYFWVQIICD
jgi:hypothetical protein